MKNIDEIKVEMWKLLRGKYLRRFTMTMQQPIFFSSRLSKLKSAK